MGTSIEFQPAHIEGNLYVSSGTTLRPDYKLVSIQEYIPHFIHDGKVEKSTYAING